MPDVHIGAEPLDLPAPNALDNEPLRRLIGAWMAVALEGGVARTLAFYGAVGYG